jgi:NADH:ubiquinone oxidoreductase subunit 6 (subunit J)
MKNEKKLEIFNRISFTFFILYLLPYIFLPIIEKNMSYLLILILPVIFLISLIINLLIKYDEIKPNNMKDISKKVSILNLLFNGINLNTVAGSLYVGTMDWNLQKEEIKKYPSITPTWLFALMIATGINLAFAFVLTAEMDTISINVVLIASIISIIFLFLGMISSSFSVYYNNGKKEILRFWKIIGIVFLALIIIIIYSAYKSGFSIKEEIRKKQEREIFEQRIQNIERTLNNY